MESKKSSPRLTSKGQNLLIIIISQSSTYSPSHFFFKCMNGYRNHDGMLTFDEFSNVVKHVLRRFPLTKQHIGRMVDMFETYDKDRNGLLDMDEMYTLLHDVDKKMTNLPAVSRIRARGILTKRTFSHSLSGRRPKWHPSRGLTWGLHLTLWPSMLMIR
jgi:hypothetical protein